MGITFDDAVNKATRNGETDYARAWAIATRAGRLYLACTDELSRAARKEYAEWVEELTVPATYTEFWDRVAEVREFVADECAREEICVDGANRFLAWMGLEEIEVTRERDYCVSVTVTLHFHVNGSTGDEDYVQRDVEKYLRVTASGNVDDANLYDADVSIDSVEVDEDTCP